MPRRPDLTKAMLLAGLICLGVTLSHQVWCREGTGAPVSFEEAGKVTSKISSQSSQLATHQASSGYQNRSESSVTHKTFSQPQSPHWFTGGLLGSLLCHYVYGYPLSYAWQEGLWPPGILDILVLMALYYLGSHLYRRLKGGDQPAKADAPPRFLRLDNGTPPPLIIREEAKPGLAAIQDVDQDFDLQVFGEEVRLLLLELYTAWNREEVSSLNGRVKEHLLEYLQMGLKIMSLREERSYLEDMILEGIMVTEARVDDGREFITVCFRGRLLDYVLDKASGKLLSGSMAYPAIFHEYWDLERFRGENTWVLQDIRDA